MSKKYLVDSWINPKVDIRSSPLQGKGMFAKEPIKKGEVIVIWGGDYTTDEEIATKEKKKGKLVIQLDDNLWSIEQRGEDLTYFMNHSCDPNVWMKDAMTLTSRRDISPNEELTTDYALWEGGDYVASWTCACASQKCRKKITGKDWRSQELQKRYKNHFSPLINKLIRKNKKAIGKIK